MNSPLLTDPRPHDHAEEIRRQMAEIRCTLRDHATTLVDTAKQKTDWRNYLLSHPWLFGSAAALIGYLLVPARRQRAGVSAQAMEEAVEQAFAKVTPKSLKAKDSMFSPMAILGLLLPVLQGMAMQGFLALWESKLKYLVVPPQSASTPKPGRVKKPR